MLEDNDEGATIRSECIAHVTAMKVLSTSIQEKLVALNKTIFEIECLIRNELEISEGATVDSHLSDREDDSVITDETSVPPPTPPTPNSPSVEDINGNKIYVRTRVVCLTK